MRTLSGYFGCTLSGICVFDSFSHSLRLFDRYGNHYHAVSTIRNAFQSVKRMFASRSDDPRGRWSSAGVPMTALFGEHP